MCTKIDIYLLGASKLNKGVRQNLGDTNKQAHPAKTGIGRRALTYPIRGFAQCFPVPGLLQMTSSQCPLTTTMQSGISNFQMVNLSLDIFYCFI